MKSVQIRAYGDYNVLEVIENVPYPQVKPGQIFVEVHATSINPFDLALVSGALKEMIPLQFPVTVGGDFAGIVKEVAEGVSQYKPGDEVYGTALTLTGGSGAFSEFVTANIANITNKPEKASFVDAAAMPLVGTSAVQALEDHIQLKSGQKILIHGGAGGIGHITIQLAKAIGAYVATTVGTKDVSFVKGLGADMVIDFTKESFETGLKDFDAVFDTVGGETTKKSFGVLKKSGILVSMKGLPDQALAQKFGVTGTGQATKTNTDHLTRLARYVDAGKIRINVDKIFPINRIRDAWEYQQTGHPRGKVVVTIK